MLHILIPSFCFFLVNGFIEDASVNVDSLIGEIYGSAMLDNDNEARHLDPKPVEIVSTTISKSDDAKKKKTLRFFGKLKLNSVPRTASKFNHKDVLEISTEGVNGPYPLDNASNNVKLEPPRTTAKPSEEPPRAFVGVALGHHLPVLESRGSLTDDKLPTSISIDDDIQPRHRDASSPISVAETSPVAREFHRPAVPDFVFANFDYDEQGNILLLNQDGFPIAQAPKGSQIPTSHAIPEYLKTAKITPVFIRPGE